MAHEDAVRELVIIALIVAGAAVFGLAALRLDLVGRIRAALTELDKLTVEDDGERM